MAFTAKYRIEWKSLKGVACRIDICYPDYAGSVTSLTPSSSPFRLNEDVNDDPFTPVRGQTGTIGILIESASDVTLLSQITPDTYNYALVRAYRAGSVVWMGFVNPAAFTQPWVAAPFAVEIPVYDMVQALYYERMPTDMRVGTYNFGMLFYNAVDTILGSDAQGIGVILESDFSDNNSRKCFMRYHVPSQFYFDFVNNDTDAGQDYSGMSYGEAFEKILQLFGMCLRNYGNCIYYFQVMNAPLGGSRYALGTTAVKHTGLLDMQDIYQIGNYDGDPTFNNTVTDITISDSDVVRADGSMSINQSKNGIKVNFGIDLLGDITYILIPKFDEEGVAAVTWDALIVRPFGNLPDNTAANAYKIKYNASVEEETDPQSGQEGFRFLSYSTTFNESTDNSAILSYLGQMPGLCPPTPQSGTAQADGVTGAIMCQYRKPDETSFKVGVFVAGGLNTPSESTVPIVFSMVTPASISLEDGTLKFSFNLFAFRNHPFNNDPNPDTVFDVVDYSGWIYYALSIGNWRYTGSQSNPWVQQSSEYNVSHNIADMGSEISIPISSVMEGNVRLSIYGIFRSADYDLGGQYFGYTDIFYMFTALDVTFTPNQSSETASDRTENLYYEEAAGYGENKEILLSIGSDQNNKKANNIILDSAGNVVSKITYNDGTTQHPERRLARRAAAYYRRKQTVYDFTIDRRNYNPLQQVGYRNDGRALLIRQTDWSDDIDTITLIEQTD